MPELTLSTILLIVLGLVVVLGLIMMFWSSIARFLGITKGTMISPQTVITVKTQCSFKCTSDKVAIESSCNLWRINYDVNGDGASDTVDCYTGGITWGGTVPTDAPLFMEGDIAWANTCGACTSATASPTRGEELPPAPPS